MGMVPEAEERLRAFRVRMEGEEKSSCTVRQYHFFVQHFLEYLGKDPAQVTVSDIERYREELVLRKKYSKNSVYLALRALSYFFRSLNIHVMDEVEVPRRTGKLPSFLSEDETHQLLESASKDVRTEAILRLLCYGGLRVGELCRLELDDVDLDQMTVRVRRGKGDKDRIIVIDESTVASLKTWLSAKATYVPGHTAEWRTPLPAAKPNSLFSVGTLTVERIVHQAALTAGIHRRVTPHTLRHTLATTLLRRGLDIRFIQKQLGHASVATTEIYTHVDTQALQEAYRHAKPKY
jgi:integrase/recombinase XerD